MYCPHCGNLCKLVEELENNDKKYECDTCRCKWIEIDGEEYIMFGG